MIVSEATRATQPKKPPKRPANFPLQPYANGQWGKKINGVRRCFGKWSDPEAAKARYFAEKDAWQAGTNPRKQPAPVTTGRSLLELADRWLVERKELVTVTDPNEKIEAVTYRGSKSAMDLLCELMDQESDPMTWTPEDFRKLRLRIGIKKDKTSGSPATKGQRIMYVRAMFQWALDARLIPRLPDYGRRFDGVAAAEKDEYRYDFEKEHGERRFELEEARLILRTHDQAAARRPGNWGSHAEMSMLIATRLHRACNYLAANTGANSKDIALLPFEDLKLDEAYLERKRRKTAALWQATLWPETVAAIREYLEVRPEPARPEWKDLVFLTGPGYPVNHDEAAIEDDKTDSRCDALRQACSKLLEELGIKVPGRTFGAWRHTFRSIVADGLGLNAQDVKRFDAVNRLMAHRIPGEANRYAKLRPEQLRRFTDVVRTALWPTTAAPAVSGTSAP